MKRPHISHCVLIVALILDAGVWERARGKPPKTTPERETSAYVNGLWFDGESFQPRTVYVKDGLLSFEEHSSVDVTIDLEGKFVIPPFGEAHNHNIDGFRPTIIQDYLRAGIFYVKNPNGVPRFNESVRDQVNKPASVDTVFSHGGLTSTGGHPTGLYRRNLSRGVFREEDGEGAFFFTIDTEEDLIQKWPAIEKVSQGFIKTYLLYSEEFDKRKSNPEYDAWYGLDPSLLPLIVGRAHRAHLRVSTHVESAYDFHVAVQAGVDEINHMPGFRPDRTENLAGYHARSSYEISETDAKLAGEKGIFVVTTLGSLLNAVRNAASEQVDNPTQEEAFDLTILHRKNLRRLHKYGVRIALGTDSYTKTSAFEAHELHVLQAFDNMTLLKIWCENTVATIFPNRKIGRLNEGYEASFLVLKGNPLDDFDSVERIELRVKQGLPLSVAQ